LLAAVEGTGDDRRSPQPFLHVVTAGPKARQVGHSFLTILWKGFAASKRVFRRPLRYVAGRWEYWLVYRAPTDDIKLAVDIPGWRLRRLMADELPGTEWLPAFAAHHSSLGADLSGPYGIILKGQLVHFCVIVTADRERQGTPLTGLKADEAEITICATRPDCRGQGLYPHVIQQLSHTLGQAGIKWVLMKTSANNVASQRGITKAGLRRSGCILTYRHPLLGRRTLKMRLFRWRLHLTRRCNSPPIAARR
jgi:RimJ/RimL family protein N-acetyltransferase